MKRSYPILLLCYIFCLSTMTTLGAEVTGSFTVNGDIDKFYPVTFHDGGFASNAATELEIGRSSVHLSGQWHGAMISKFRFHTFNWGNGAHFIDVDLRQNGAVNVTNKVFVAGWKDATTSNSTGRIIIWLRGSTTYYYKSNYMISPVIYDGVQNPLPFHEQNGPVITCKTAVDPGVNNIRMNYNHTIYFASSGVNYFAGNVGVGMTSPGNYKLAVEGTIGGRKVKVTQQSTWADFVFEPEYKLPSIQEVEQFVKTHKHLPDIPSAKEVAEDGVDLGEINKRLLQKIEEQMLYIIELNKRLNVLEKKHASQ